MKIYSATIYCKAFKRDIKLLILFYTKLVKKESRNSIFQKTERYAKKNVQYYRVRFQFEFLYRDAKQYCGLTTCQDRSENKIDSHFNAASTAVNLAKIE